jgi:hypothetical protein
MCLRFLKFSPKTLGPHCVYVKVLFKLKACELLNQIFLPVEQ